MACLRLRDEISKLFFIVAAGTFLLPSVLAASTSQGDIILFGGDKGDYVLADKDLNLWSASVVVNANALPFGCSPLGNVKELILRVRYDPAGVQGSWQNVPIHSQAGPYYGSDVCAVKTLLANGGQCPHVTRVWTNSLTYQVSYAYNNWASYQDAVFSPPKTVYAEAGCERSSNVVDLNLLD